MENENFKIDFFELAILAKAAIPPKPIGVQCFWDKLTDEYWEVMTETQRVKLFNYLKSESRYIHGLVDNHGVIVFNSRFDPNNQYMVKYKDDTITKASRAFLLYGRYHISKNHFIPESSIIKSERINVTDLMNKNE